MQTKGNTLSFEGQAIYIGIDSHLKNWTVTIMLEHSTHKTFSQNPDAKDLANYLHRNFPNGNYYSAYEASYCGFSIHRSLESYGIHNIVVNPADIPTTDKERKQKEDRRDSRKIAKSLRNGELQGIYIPSSSMVEFRNLVRYRRTLVKEITRNKNRIKSLLYFYGINIPLELDTASRHWSSRFSNWLRSLTMTTDYGKMVLNNILDTTEFLRSNLLKIEKILRNIYDKSEFSFQLKLLRSIPGIGIISAFTFLTEIGNINRFKNLDSLCSFVGLVPSTHSSGEQEKTGSITSRSNKPLRSIIIEAAWFAIRLDPTMALAFNNFRNRMRPSKAIIRIAKKLLSRIKYVLKNETEYEYAIA